MYCKSFFIEELSYPAHQEDFMMLIIPAISPALERLQLRELLLPIAQYVRLDPA
ncbi:MAG: hypothetical protein NTAFB09_15880 [Nitrosospira sp.]